MAKLDPKNYDSEYRELVRACNQGYEIEMEFEGDWEVIDSPGFDQPADRYRVASLNNMLAPNPRVAKKEKKVKEMTFHEFEKDVWACAPDQEIEIKQSWVVNKDVGSRAIDLDGYFTISELKAMIALIEEVEV